MRQKLIAVIFGLIVMTNAVIPAITSASGYNQWSIAMNEFVDKVGETTCLSTNVVYNLWHEGYSSRDIATAGMLAMNNEVRERLAVSKASNSKNLNESLYVVNQLLAMKNKADSWQKISRNLNVSEADFKYVMEKVNKLIRQEPCFW